MSKHNNISKIQIDDPIVVQFLRADFLKDKKKIPDVFGPVKLNLSKLPGRIILANMSRSDYPVLKTGNLDIIIPTNNVTHDQDYFIYFNQLNLFTINSQLEVHYSLKILRSMYIMFVKRRWPNHIVFKTILQMGLISSSPKFYERLKKYEYRLRTNDYQEIFEARERVDNEALNLFRN